MQKTSKQKKISGLPKKRILCITDQEELKKLVRLTLGIPHMHIDYTHVDNGEEGVQIAFRKKPHIILMDLGLHKLSGVDAARQIKDALPETKIVMLTMYKCGSSPIGL